jgi:hypothetical protein
MSSYSLTIYFFISLLIKPLATAEQQATDGTLLQTRLTSL